MNEKRLARVYAIMQRYNNRYSPEVGLNRGTIFPELYQPYLKEGDKRR